MPNKSYADRERAQNPLSYEKARAVIDASTLLKLALEDLGLSQRELARRLGRQPSIVSRQLNGMENLSIGKFVELAFALSKRVHFELSDIEQQRDRSGTSHSGLRLAWDSEGPFRQRIRIGEPPEDHPTSMNRTAA